MKTESALTPKKKREIIVPASRLHTERAPHIRAGGTLIGMSLDVLLALLPLSVWSAILFGWHSAALIAVSVVSAILTELWAGLLFRRPRAVLDGTAAVTGLILALLLPPETPVLVAAVGSVFAIFVVKQCFGGLGCNIFNPAVSARLFLAAAFPGKCAFTAASAALVREAQSPLSLLFGVGNSALADASALLLLAGGIYLICRRQIAWEAPLTFCMISLLGTLLFPAEEDVVISLVLTFCSGGVPLAAFFLLTDPVTAPMTTVGRFLYGVLVGIMALLLRSLGCAEGVLLAVLFMNLFSLLLDRFSIFLTQRKGGAHG